MYTQGDGLYRFVMYALSCLQEVGVATAGRLSNIVLNIQLPPRVQIRQGDVLNLGESLQDYVHVGSGLCSGDLRWNDWVLWRRHQQVSVDGAHCRG